MWAFQLISFLIIIQQIDFIISSNHKKIFMQQSHNQYSMSFNKSKRNLSANRYDEYLFEKNIPYNKKRQVEVQKQSMEQIAQQNKNQQNKQQGEPHIPVSFSLGNKKVKRLIMDVITSADQTVKAIIPYGHTEIQQYCCAYFLNKEKLYSYLHANNPQFFTENHKSNHNLQKRKHKKKESVSSKLIEMVPINHLQRLQKIVYNKIIPILQNDLQAQKKKNQKLIKKGRQPNSDYNQGIMLLQRLNENQRIAVDQCAQILQKFIIRIMQKQQKMLAKINRIQQKLNQEIKKTQILSEESKKWEQHRIKIQKQLNRQKKNLYKYQDFSKQIKLIFLDKDKLIPQISQKENLQQILNKIKLMHNEDRKHNKRCDHKQKETHSSCKEQISKSQKHIKSLKDVIKSINTENQHLQEECDNIENRLKITNDLLRKFQLESQKMVKSNQQLNSKIEQLQNQQNYKTKLIEQYLRIIDRLQQCIKTNQQTTSKQNQQIEGYLDLITKHTNEKDEYIKHIMESEQKQKQLEDLLGRKEAQMQELFSQFNSKSIQINQHQRMIRHLQGQIKEQSYSIQIVSKENETLNQELKLFKISQQRSITNLLNQQKQSQPKLSSNNLISINILKQQASHSHTNNVSSQKGIIHFLQAEQGGLRQTSLSLSPNKYKQLKSKIKQVIKENGDLKFEIERMKTFSALQKQAFQKHQNLHTKEKEELKYLKTVLQNFMNNKSIPTNLQTNQNSLTNKQQPTIKILDQQPTKPLLSAKTDDFIPAFINIQIPPQQIQQQFNVPATIITETIDTPLTYNKKRQEREDFIPGSINIQILPYNNEIHQNLYSYQQKPLPTIPLSQEYHKLTDQLNLSNCDMGEQFKEIHKQIEQKTKKTQEIKIVDEQVESQPTKIQQLLDLNQHIGEHIIKLKQKMAKQLTCKQGLSEIQTEIQYMTSLLKIYKRNTLKKLQKIQKTELLKKQADEQIQRLKKRLDEALIVNQIYSTQSNSQDSDFTFPQYLSNFFNNANPFVNRTHILSSPDIHQHNNNKQIFTQTQIPTVNKKITSFFESEIINVNQSLLMSQVRNLRLTDLYSKQLLNQGNYSPTLTNKPVRAESIVNFGDIIANTSLFSLRDTANPKQKVVNPESQSNKIQQSHNRLFQNNYISERRESIVSLDRLLEEQNWKQRESNKLQQKVNQDSQDRQQNKEIANISYLNSPQNEVKIYNYQCEAHSINDELQQMKQILLQKQQYFNKIITQKNQQIERLKSIINIITKSQQISMKLLPKGSKILQQGNKSYQNENIIDLLIKQKEQIQRLNTLIKNHEFHQKIQKLKRSYQIDGQNQQDNKNDQIQIKYMPIGNNQVIIYEMMPVNAMNNSLKVQKQTKSEIKEEKNNNQLRLKSFQNIQPQNKSNSPKKQIITKSESSKQRKHSTTQRGYDFDWSDLVPEYFGKKQQDHI